MTTETIPLNSVQINERSRPAEDLEPLCASIKRYGLLQPILVDQNNVLQDGFRRYSACKLIGMVDVPVYRRSNLNEAEYFEIELESNFQRKDFTWQEIVHCVTKVHKARLKVAALAGISWTQVMTGELLGGYSDSYVSNCLQLDKKIDTDVFKDCTSITDAVKILYRQKEDEAVALLANKTQLNPLDIDDLFKDDSYVPIVNDWKPGPKDGYTDQKCSVCNAKDVNCTHCLGTGYEPIPTTVISLSKTLLQGDSVFDILPQFPAECIDHIITDPPYAIDVDMMDQATNAIADIGRIRDTHQVADNMTMLKALMPQAYRILKPNAFFIFWCDEDVRDMLKVFAEDAGFKVQRWSYMWIKSSQCKNGAATINFTKHTEIAMVCRKGQAFLTKANIPNYTICANNADRLSNPFAKPGALWKELIEAVSIQGQTILDPFAGEGSCPLECLRLNRKIIAIEKDDNHFNYMQNSVKEYWKQIFKQVQFV